MSIIHDFDFEPVDKIKGGYIKRFLLYPPFWSEPSNKITVNLKWKKVKFNELNLKKIENKRGVYCFVVEPQVDNFFKTKYLFYIGKTNRTLKKRYKEYLEEKKGKRKSRSKVMNMMQKYKKDLYYYFATIENKVDVNETEDKLIDTFIPHVNTRVKRAKIKPEYQYLYE